MNTMQESAVYDLTVCDALSAVGPPETWNGLVDKSTYPNVFRRWEWISAWWKWFGGNRELYLLRLTRGPELVGIAPLYSTRARSGSRKLMWIGVGGPTFPEYLGPIVHRDYMHRAVREFVACLSALSTWDVIEFPDVPPDDCATKALIDELAKEFPVIRAPGVVCPYLALPDSYESLLAKLGKRRRENVRRQVRNAQKHFRVELDLVERLDRLRDAFPGFIELNRSSRALHGDRSPFANANYAGFHRDAIEALLPERIARPYVLTFEGDPVAFQYGYLYGQKYYYFQAGFDGRLKEYSPGAVLLQMIFAQLIDERVREFDFLRGEEAYKSQFGNLRRNTQTTLVFRRFGIAYAARRIQSNIVAPVRRRAKRWLVR